MTRRVTCPLSFFGHQLGADRKIARWDRIVEYCCLLESESDRLKVIDMGPSTEGQPFLALIVSSPENLSQLDYYKDISRRLADPGELSEEEAKELASKGKVIVLQSMSLHASEIGGTQMAPEMVYEMLESDSADNLRILENVISVIVPCFNPDGQLMIADWYESTLGTDYEGCAMPWLYHKYSGHDNNRDAFALNLVESQYVAKLMFEEFHPQVYQDHHHMGSYGARYYVAPYREPIRPFGDPLVWREVAWYGSHMAYKLEEEGRSGVLSGAQFPAWGHLGFHRLTLHHNMAGMLTESASANLASPKYIAPDQLTGSGEKSFPEYRAQTSFPNPWPGGWWRLRDIVEQQKISAVALNDLAARNRGTILRNAYRKAVRQTERGAADQEYAYLIPPNQHDDLTVLKLIQLLLNQGIRVHRSRTPVKIGPASYPAGSYLVKLAQPKMGVLKNLLSRTLYPRTFFTTNAEGASMPYDTATDTVHEFMGVEAIPTGCGIEGAFDLVREVERPRPHVEDAPFYLLDARQNDSYLVVNRLLEQGVDVSRSAERLVAGTESYPPGTFITAVPRALAQQTADETGVEFRAVTEEDVSGAAKVAAMKKRIGLFQRYWGGNTDEGWTRLVLDNFGFEYLTVRDADIKAGSLAERIDVLILPSDEEAMVVDISKATGGRAGRARQWFGDAELKKYQSGLGEEGLAQIRRFVKEGGTLLALNKSVDIAINTFGLKVENVVRGKSSLEYQTHGSTLNAQLDTAHPAAYGMPEDAVVFSWDSPVLRVSERLRAEKYEVFMRYADKDLLVSGELYGEELLAGMAAGVSVSYGSGRIVLLAVAPQHRAQTHGTFKLLFNSLL